MENINLIDSFAEFKELKNIDRATMMSVIEEVFRSVLVRQFETDENFDIIINTIFYRMLRLIVFDFVTKVSAPISPRQYN